MPENDDEFYNNPFRLLDRAKFPKSAGEGCPSGIDPQDRFQFLQAVSLLQDEAHPRQEKKAQGFTIADQCALPNISMKKKRKQERPKAEPKIEKQEVAEEDIFAVAMRNTTPLTGKGRKVPAARPKAKPRNAEMDFSIADYLAARLEFAISCSEEYMEGKAVGLDDLLMNRLKEGQFSPEAHLDLHGLNAEQAFEALKDFMRQSWYKGLRVVLIVTGRGRNSPAGMAILRQKLPYWLTHEPFKRIVLAFCTARSHDGGPGSIYALLRKSRKKGPIRWETLAFDTDLF